jgi:hypothetical protein
MTQVVSVILMIIGLVLIVPSLITYLSLNRMENKMSPDEVATKIFKKKVPNPTARLDLIHIILLGLMIAGLALLLAGVITGVAGNVNG